MNYTINYEHGLRHSYMYIKSADISDNSYETKLMRETSIPGSLEMNIDISDTEAAIRYDISGLEPMDKYLESHPMSHLDISKFMEDLNTLLLSLEEFMISENSIVLDPSAVFYKEETNTWIFPLIPDNKLCFNADLSEFLTYVLKHIDYKDDRAVIIGYSIFQETTKDFYQITDLLKIVRTNIEKENIIRNQLISTENTSAGTSHDLSSSGLFTSLGQKYSSQDESNACKNGISQKKKMISEDGIFRPIDAGLMPEDSKDTKFTTEMTQIKNSEKNISSCIKREQQEVSEKSHSHENDISFSSDYGVDDYPETDILPGVEKYNLSESADSKLFGIFSYPKKGTGHHKTLQDKLDKQASDLSFKGKILISVLLMILIPSLVWILKGSLIFHKTLPLIIALEVGLSLMIALDVIMNRLPDDAS